MRRSRRAAIACALYLGLPAGAQSVVPPQVYRPVVLSTARDPTDDPCNLQVPAVILKRAVGATVMNYTCQDPDGDGVYHYKDALLAGDVALDELTTATSPWFNVASAVYGAATTNDGATNEPLLQAAADACEAAGGGVILIPKMYKTSGLVVADGCSVQCVGNASGLQCDGCDVLLDYVAGGGITGGRAKVVADCNLDGNQEAGTVFRVGNVAKLEIRNNNMHDGADTGSICADLDRLQNSLVTQNQFQSCSTLVHYHGDSSNNTIQENDFERPSLYSFHAEEDFNAGAGENQHGTYLVGNILERERYSNDDCTAAGLCGAISCPCCTGDGAGTCTGSPYPQPTYHIYITGGRDWHLQENHVGTPAQGNDIRVIGADGTNIPAGQYGATNVQLVGGSMNLAVNNASAECDAAADPYPCCTGAGTGCVQDWQTECGIYVDGPSVRFEADGFFTANGNSRCYVEAEATSSTVVTMRNPLFQLATRDPVVLGDSDTIGTVIEEFTDTDGSVRVYIGEAEKYRLASTGLTAFDGNFNLRSAASNYFRCQTPSGFACGLRWFRGTTGDDLAWGFGRVNDSGADLELIAYDDSGANPATVLSIDRDEAGDRRGLVQFQVPEFEVGFAGIAGRSRVLGTTASLELYDTDTSILGLDVDTNCSAANTCTTTFAANGTTVFQIVVTP